jgi:N-acetylglucosaminyldiphosphoundecaprenol N-acetyl-beta-D-mannosaminyltransferase
MPGVADELASRLCAKFSGLRVAGVGTPPMLATGERDTDESIRQINASGADVVWVGMSTPKQDWWVANHRGNLQAPVLIAVGAAFDFHSGRVRQAPVWMQRNGLEWLYRLSRDPRRLWRRYAVCNAGFIAALLRERLRRRLSRDEGPSVLPAG